MGLQKQAAVSSGNMQNKMVGDLKKDSLFLYKNSIPGVYIWKENRYDIHVDKKYTKILGG